LERIDNLADRKTDRNTERQKGSKTERQKDKNKGKLGIGTDRKKDRQIDR
jgi:hypothetical protein